MKTKENLWHMVMESLMKQYSGSERQGDSLTDDTDAGTRLKNMIADMVRYMSAHPQLNRIMMHEAVQLSPRLVWLIDNYAKAPFEQFVKLTKQAQREGSVRGHLDAARLRYAVIAMATMPTAVSAEYEYFIGKSPFSRSEVNRTIKMICEMVFIDPPEPEI